jgi:DNA polymerase
MTAEEKKNIAFFIDIAYGWTRGGYFREEREYNFTDDGESAPGAPMAQNPLVMVIGEVSGSEEDARLLDKMLGSIGLSKESNCFITNVVEYESRLQSMKPRFILCLGESASQTLLHSAEPIGKLRGKFMDFKTQDMTIPLIATYHPGALLRNEELKRPCWDDLKLLRAALMPALNGAE